MLGIPEQIAREVAEQKTMHSWLTPLLKETGEKYENMESELEKWVETTARRLYPEQSRVGRILRETAGLYLEREALMVLAVRRPGRVANVPIPATIEEAVEIGAAEAMYATAGE